MRTLLVVFGLRHWEERMGILVWEGASRAEDREWGALLAVAIDGGVLLISLGTKVQVPTCGLVKSWS